MRADERGRVPFAVIAVLLLVSSATVATTMAPAPAPDEPAVDVVVDRVEAEQRTALRRAVREAANDAASEPVVQRADTPVGRALSGEAAFRDSLRLRAYVAAREHLHALERRRGDVVATTTLPPVDPSSRANVSAAIDRVALERTNETAITVELRNVTTTVRRGDRVLDRSSESPSVTVATPVLAMHDRVTDYERRLNADVTSPGLERRLAVTMNAIGWVRGYAQYRGAPVGNVISNQHVALATNAGILGVQRSTIGRIDADARRQYHRELGKFAAQESLGIQGSVGATILQEAIKGKSMTPANEIEGAGIPSRGEPMTVGINRTARDVFLMMDRGESAGSVFLNYEPEWSLDYVLGRTYSAEAKLATATTAHRGGTPTAAPPGAGWTKVASTLDSSTTVSPADADRPVGTGGDWHAFDTYARRVVTDYELTTTWADGNETVVRTTTSQESWTVTVTLLGRHASDLPGPDRRIRGVHERGAGPLDGPNLAAVEGKARERLLRHNGGRDAVAQQAATDSLPGQVVTVYGQWPEGLRTWVYRDLSDLREEVYDVSVEVDRRAVGTFEANPPRLLKQKLQSRRAELIGADGSYDGVADRARVAARAKYLTLVTRALERRAASREQRRGALDDALNEADAGSVDDLQQSAYAAVDGDAVRKPALRGPGGPVRLRVDAAPAYLERGSVGASKYAAIDGSMTPLDTRNLNVFALPYGDVMDGFLNAIIASPSRTSLATAAQALESSEQFGASTRVTFSTGIRRPYEWVVANKVDNLRQRAVTVLAGNDVGRSGAQRRRIVRSALSRWEGTADRALALSNGSAATAIVAEADERTDLSPVVRDKLYLRLDRAIRRDLETGTARPLSAHVKTAAGVVKAEAGPRIREMAKPYEDEAIEKITKSRVSTLPSGLPVAPVPGYWYATTNVWHVEVRGEYARFAVRATRGRPTVPGSGIVYARDGDPVTLDVDGDGTGERLGTSRRVEFNATVDVVVVVPPGPQGVGDVAGPMNEVSEGWATPE